MDKKVNEFAQKLGCTVELKQRYGNGLCLGIAKDGLFLDIRPIVWPRLNDAFPLDTRLCPPKEILLATPWTFQIIEVIDIVQAFKDLYTWIEHLESFKQKFAVLPYNPCEIEPNLSSTKKAMGEKRYALRIGGGRKEIK